MKRILIVILSLFTLSTWAGILVLKNGNNIENVESLTIADIDVKYIIEGQEFSIPTKDAEAYLDDNGKYQEIRVNHFTELIQTGASEDSSAVVDISTEFSSDLSAFFNAMPNEAKTAVYSMTYLQNHSAKFKDPDRAAILSKALDAYVTEKYHNKDDITAIRAYFGIIIDNVEKVKSSKKK